MNEMTTVEDLVYSVRPFFESVAVSRDITFEREAEFAIQAILANDFAKRIALENRQSVIDAVTNISAMGLSLNPAKKQAYLVPRKGGIHLSISYMGLLDLAMDTGSIMWGQARLVYEADMFRMNGLDQQPTHKFDPFSTDRGEIVGAYVSVKTADGDYLTEAMSTAEINAIRDRSDAWRAWVTKKRSCPWVTDWGEMAKKTVVHRAYKYWPKTDRLENAIHYLNNEGGEVISVAPDHDPELTQEWLDRAAKCESVEALTAVWQSGLAEIKGRNDKKAYDIFKAAVVERGAILREAEETTLEQA